LIPDHVVVFKVEQSWSCNCI